MRRSLPFYYFLAFITFLHFPSINVVVNATRGSEFDQRIRAFLEKYVTNKVEGEAPGEPMMQIHVANAAELVTTVANDFLPNEMMKKCQEPEKNFLFIFFRRELAKFREEFHKQSSDGGDELLNASSGTESEVMKDRNNARLLQLLLSFTIQLGYTVGSKELGMMENDGHLLKQLLKLYVCLEQINARQQKKSRKQVSNVYLRAQFKYGSTEKALYIKFRPETDFTADLGSFQLLKNMFIEGETLEGKKSVANTIALIEFLDKKKQNEEIDIERLPFNVYTVNVKLLMEMWSEIEHGHNAFFYQLKHFGHDLCQRLLDAEQLQQGLFQLFPAVKNIIGDLANKMKNDAHEFLRSLSNFYKYHLRYRPNLHFEEVMPVEFGLEGDLQKLIKARDMVAEWSKKLEEAVEETCDYVIDDIFSYKKHFDDYNEYKLFNFDKDVGDNLAIFSTKIDDYLDKRLKCQVEHINAWWADFPKTSKKHNEIEKKLETMKQETKRKLPDTGSDRELDAKIRKLDSELKAAKTELDVTKENVINSKEQWEEVRLKECMAQRVFLLKQSEKIVAALVNLEEKVQKIVFADHHSAFAAAAVKGVEEAGTSASGKYKQH